VLEATGHSPYQRTGAGLTDGLINQEHDGLDANGTRRHIFAPSKRHGNAQSSLTGKSPKPGP
jgi:hypothetical protein